MSLDITKWKINKHDHAKLQPYDGKIVTRFPPEPSGYLHIGHVKAVLINYVIAKRYHGRMLFRLDDTNPELENEEFTNAIIEDIQSLGIIPDSHTYSSDYFDEYINCAEYLIKEGLAYVDDTPPDKVKEERDKMIENSNRQNTVEDNIILWNQMKLGQKTDAILRLKGDMKSKNATLRDPTLFRSKNMPHHRTGDKYKVYPSYDFVCPIADSIEGVTHVYRSVEFAGDRDDQYEYILDLLRFHKPVLHTYGKMTFTDAVLSKRKIKALIDTGDLEGWSEPRLMTLRGLFKKGLCLEALYDYISRVGFAKASVNMTQDALWKTNRKFIDKMATRYVGLTPADAVNFRINYNGYNVGEYEMKPKFLKNPELGDRKFYYSDQILLSKSELESVEEGEEITLYNWGNSFVSKENNTLTLNLDGDFKTTKNKLVWLPLLNNHQAIKITTKTYKNIDEPCVVKEYLADPDIINVKKGDYIQLLKGEYYICNTDNIFITVPS